MTQQFYPTPTLADRVDPLVAAPRHIRPPVGGGLAATIRLWLARGRQRRRLGELAECDAHLLDDIGMSREVALREAAKPIWRK